MTLGNRLVAEASEPATRPAAGREEGPAGKRGQKLEQRLCEYPLRDEALTGHLETDRQTDRGRKAQLPGTAPALFRQVRPHVDSLL